MACAAGLQALAVAVPSLAAVPLAHTEDTSGGLLLAVAAVARTTPPSGQLQQQPAGLGSASGGGSRLPATDGLEDDDDDDDDDEGYESGSVAEEEATEDGEDSLAPAATGVNRLRVECKACMQLGVFRKDGQPTTILAAPVYVRGHCRGLQWTNNDGRKDPAGYHKAWLAVMEEKWAWQKEEKAAARKRKHAAE